jgi:hypothetical protein
MIQELIDTKIHIFERIATCCGELLELQNQDLQIQEIVHTLYMQLSDIALELKPFMPYVKEKNMAVAILCYHLVDWRKGIDKSKVDNTFKMIE